MTSPGFLRSADVLPAGRAAGADRAYRPPVRTVLIRRDEVRATPSGVRADVLAGAAALLLVVLALLVGMLTGARRYGAGTFPNASPRFGEYPVLGHLAPHLGPGTVLAVVLAFAVVAWGPALAERSRWPVLLVGAYLTSVGWILALAMVDGWHQGVVHRMATRDEYLYEVPGITDIPTMLRTFTTRILSLQPDSWTTHVSGHPPGATLTFVWLDRIGLGGPTAAALFCIATAGLVAVAVPVTVAALGRADHARAVVPFVCLLPGAVWLGVSADAMFAAVAAVGIMLLALGASRGRMALCAAGGAVLGWSVFLSYGLLLMAPVAVAVVLVTRCWRALAWAVPAALAVAGVFALAGFWWLDGYHLVVQRYYEGIGAIRPYWYWVWANLACLALAVGPAVAAGLRRAAPEFLPVLARPAPVVALARGAALAVLTADVSGLSKAETERIWLPFAVWLVVAAALLPRSSRRGWLAAQAVTALAVNHLLLTNW
jgi:methylthioxylose transferase